MDLLPFGILPGDSHMNSTADLLSQTGWFLPVLYGLLGAVPAMLSMYTDFESRQDKLNLGFDTHSINNGKKNVYDFIVVGAGSAGGVVANRLSKHFNVLLLERGGEPHPLSSVPSGATILLNYPEVDYMYRSIPQRASCLGLNNRRSSWSRGMGLGGSSNLNLMVYLRGHPRDYANWVNITGDSRWSYENLLPFFLKSEDYCFKCEPKSDIPDTVQPQYHRQGGPLTIGKPSYNPLVEQFLKGVEWNGIPIVDLNAPYTEGAAGVTYTQKKGRRWGVYRGYIEPIRKRKTLTIHKHSRVYHVLFRGKNNEAFGVEYEQHGKKKIALATKEVILSAGALDSAKILMLSGIGPKKHLESLGIKTRVNSPVGQNLQDHIGTFPGPFLVDLPKSSFIKERDVDAVNSAEFIANGTGTLVSTGINANAFFSSYRALAAGESGWPDTQWMFLGIGNSITLDRDFSHAFNIREDILTPFYEPTKGHDAFQITVMLSRPKQRGEILLRSSDYRDDLIGNPRYFEDPDTDDIKVMVEGVKRAVYMSENAPSFKKVNTRLSPVPFPPCAHIQFRSDPYWECFVRHYSISIYHYSGTTAMGPRGSPKAVVDSELRVIGTKRLRVIDTGIMPNVVTVNTNGPTIMIGERGAQFVLETWEDYIGNGKFGFGSHRSPATNPSPDASAEPDKSCTKKVQSEVKISNV